MLLRLPILGPTNSTRPRSDLESQTELELPVVYPPQAVSSDTTGAIAPDAITTKRIHLLIRAPFRLLTETLQCWNLPGESPDIRLSLLAAVTASILIPVLCTLHFSHANYVMSFTVLVVAMHPLVYLLNFVIDDLAIRYGETIGCLLHATTMNAVEVIVAVIGLIRNEPKVVQAALLGSLIVDMLLIPSLCFFFGGLRLSDHHFNRMIAHSKSPMVILGFIAFILPSTLDPVHFVNDKPNTEQREATSNLLADRIISIIMLLTYVGYTVFQLLLGRTQRNICAHQSVSFCSDAEPRGDGLTSIVAGDSAANPADASANPPPPNSPDEDTRLVSGASEEQYSGSETPKISAAIALIILFGVSGLLVVTTVFLDDSLQRMTENSLMSKWFVGFILSPLVANMPDAIVAVIASINGKPFKNLTIAEALSVQMTFFTIPFVTIIAWGMGKSFSFSSDLFGSTVLALSAILTLFLQNERGTSPKGVILMSTYLVVVTTSWFYPGPSNAAVPNLLTNVDEAQPRTWTNRRYRSRSSRLL